MISSGSLLRHYLCTTARSLSTIAQDPPINALAYHHGKIIRGHLHSDIHLFIPELKIDLSETGIQKLSSPHNFVQWHVNGSETRKLNTKTKKVTLSATRINQLVQKWNLHNNKPRLIDCTPIIQKKPAGLEFSMPIDSVRILIKEWEDRHYEEKRSLQIESQRLIESLGHIPQGLLLAECLFSH